ncbi:MAG: hypothetical protein AAGB12_10170 [Pseudomonadota bacterium]
MMFIFNNYKKFGLLLCLAVVLYLVFFSWQPKTQQLVDKDSQEVKLINQKIITTPSSSDEQAVSTLSMSSSVGLSKPINQQDIFYKLKQNLTQEKKLEYLLLIAQDNPVAALEWLMTNDTASPLFLTHYAMLNQSYLDKDPQKAGKLLLQLPDGLLLDNIASHYLSEIIEGGHIETALLWYEQIDSKRDIKQQLKSELMTQVAMNTSLDEFITIAQNSFMDNYPLQQIQQNARLAGQQIQVSESSDVRYEQFIELLEVDSTLTGPLLQGYISQVAHQHPLEIQGWIQEIADEDLQEQAVLTLASYDFSETSKLLLDTLPSSSGKTEAAYNLVFNEISQTLYDLKITEYEVDTLLDHLPSLDETERETIKQRILEKT